MEEAGGEVCLAWVVGDVELEGTKLIEIANDVIVALALPQAALPTDLGVDLASSEPLDRLKKLFEFVGLRSEEYMDVVRHDDEISHENPGAMEVKEGVRNNLGGDGRAEDAGATVAVESSIVAACDLAIILTL